MKIIFKILTLSLILLSNIAFANPEAINKAIELLKQKDPQAAYALLAPLEDELAENVQYNYLLGIAALDTKQAGKAVFALERAVAIAPDNALYRAELGRAYFELGERHSAKAEFDRVLSSNPTEDAKAGIQRYLSTIGNMDDISKTRMHAFIDFGMGVDSNINSATASTTVAVPALGAIFNLDPGARAQSDQYYSFSGGADFIRPVSPTFNVLGGVKVSQRANMDRTEFDLGSLDLNLGLTKSHKNSLWQLNLTSSELSLDGNSFRRAHGLIGQWQYHLDDYSQVTMYGQYNRITFPDQDTRDADRYVLGAGYAKAFVTNLKPILYIGAFGGTENARDSDFDHISFNMLGLRLGGQISVNPRMNIYASSSFEHRRYDQDDPFFLSTRNEKQYDVSIGTRYLVFPTLTFNANVGYTNKDSNIAVFEYERSTLAISLRKDFNW